MASFSGADDTPGTTHEDVTKTGTLWKLPRGSKPSLLNALGSNWQERDFVLDVDRGTLSYYAKGQAGVPKAYKGQVTLAGGLISAVEGTSANKAFVFELSDCVHDDGCERPLKLAATSQHDMDAWVIAIRATMKKHGVKSLHGGGDRGGLTASHAALFSGASSSEDKRAKARGEAASALTSVEKDEDAEIEAADVYATQELTMDAVRRIRAQLNDSKELADATSATLKQQGEQLDEVARDVEGLNENVDKADKNFDRLERWRIFGGRSRKKGDRAAARARQEQTAVDESKPDVDPLYGGDAAASGDPSTSSQRPNTSMRGDDDKEATTTKNSRRNIAHGLNARDDAERDALDRVAANDDEINAGLDDIDAVIDALGDTARSLGETTKRHNRKLNAMAGRVDDASSGVARINERAHYNVRYLS